MHIIFEKKEYDLPFFLNFFFIVFFENYFKEILLNIKRNITKNRDKIKTCTHTIMSLTGHNRLGSPKPRHLWPIPSKFPPTPDS